MKKFLVVSAMVSAHLCVTTLFLFGPAPVTWWRTATAVDTPLSQLGPPRAEPLSTAHDLVASGRAAVTRFDDLPLRLEPNLGQAHPTADYVARGADYTLLLQSERLTVVLPDAVSLRIEWVRANPLARAEASGKQAGVTHYFRGSDTSQWIRGVPGFSRVTYRQVYDGIDLVYYGKQRRLEYDFVVAAGVDPSVIEFSCEGTETLAVTADGELELRVGNRRVFLERPVVYQNAPQGRVEIAGTYEIRGDRRVGFALGAYDPDVDLVIDPVLSYSTFFGGNGQDTVYDIAVDFLGNAYITGSTNSSDIHTSPGAVDTTGGVGGFFDPSDVFVAKLDSTGSNLIYGTYLSGGGADVAYSIDVDALGCAYVTGTTDSEDDTLTVPDESFPLRNALQPVYGGDTDLFVTKLNADGSDLIYSTYLGGDMMDRGDSEQEQPAIAVDNAGNAYVAGTTQSANFPVTPGAFSTVGPGPFASKLNAAGSALTYSTFLGGNEFVFVWDVEVDETGQAHVAGFTGNPNLPTTGGSYQPIKANAEDAFLYKINAAGSGLVYCTYLGGNLDDFVHALALDDSGNVYVTGISTSSDYPVTSGTVPPGGAAMVTKLNATGSAIQYSLFMSNGAIGYGIAVDPSRRANITGDGFASPPDRDVFFSRIHPTGAFAQFETSLGGLFRDIGYGVAVDLAGNAYLAGVTNSNSFPGDPTINPNPLQGSIRVVPDGFVLKITTDTPVGIAESVPRNHIDGLRNYPNPFNPTTTITWTQRVAAHTTLRVYDVSGRLVRTLFSGTVQPGTRSVRWDAANDRGGRMASGTYFYRIESGEFSESHRMVLLK